MMRRLALPMALAGAVALGIAGTAAAIEIKAAQYLSPKHPLGVGYEVLKEVVERESKGDMKIRHFAGGSLLAAKSIPDGVRDGVADVGAVVMTYAPSYYPYGLLLGDMAMIGENDIAAVFAICELYMHHCKGCQDESAAINQVALSGLSTPQYVLVGTSPMNTLETIKGKRLRAGGPLWARFADHVGATAVNIPSSEIYEGISRKIVDAAMYARGGLKTHGLADVATHVSEVPLGSFRSAIYYSYNLDSWKKLTPAQRGIFLKGVAAGVVANQISYYQGEEEGIALGKEKGVQFLQPDAEMMKRLNEFVEKDAKETIIRAKEKGIADAEEFIAKYRELYAKYEPMVAPIMKDADKLTELLYKEVYAKVDTTKFGVK